MPELSDDDVSRRSDIGQRTVGAIVIIPGLLLIEV